MKNLAFVISLLFCYFLGITYAANCKIPADYIKKLYARADGKRAKLYLDKDDKLRYLVEESRSNEDKPWPTDNQMKVELSGECYRIVSQNTHVENSVKDLTIVFRNTTKNCLFCFHLFHRSDNVIEYRHTQCNSISLGREVAMCQSLKGTTLITGFADSDTYVPYNCKSLFEGIFKFTYELAKSYGECKNRKNIIRACQATGTSLRDNTIFQITKGWCPGLVGTAAGTQKSGTVDEKWKCYGVWTDPSGHIKAAIQLDNVDIKFRYRCMLTTVDQQPVNNERRWGMTTSADCSELTNDYSGAAFRLKLWPGLDDKTQLPFLKPACNLPKSYVGKWFFPGDYNTDVTINSTHMVYRRMKSQYEYEDVYYSCRQSQENRYLMATVAVGRCEMDFVCFYFLPRHHNIIRFRTSRPFRYFPSQDSPDYQVQLFRQACHWSSFTLNNREWVYQYFILNPPVPVQCPIQGRFWFVQTGDPSERYRTKIPGGVTLRPRVQILCDRRHNESDIAVCTDNLKAMKLDVVRCMVLDHSGRPTSEYDIADNTITCVGYWMEDARSFLITYDPDDPVSKNFRCWVYKRIGFHTYLMSRSSGGFCSPEQTAETNTSSKGASLHLEMHSNEREFDGCPMAYDDGSKTFFGTSVLQVFAAAPQLNRPILFLILVSLLTFALSYIRCHFNMS